MRIIKLATMMMVVLGIVCSCGQQGNKPVGLDNSPVVAERIVTSQGDTMVVCNMDLVTDTIDFPMSLLLSDLEVVKLNDSEEALIGDGYTFISPKHIVSLAYQSGVKLFNRDGSFITSVSKRGNGPDEYRNGLYDAQIDEANNRLYFINFNANKLMNFDLRGNALQHIPLAKPVNKGRFHIDAEKKQIYMAALCFVKDEPAFYVQDFEGNIIQEVPSNHLASQVMDFSNEVYFQQNTSALDYDLFWWGQDRLDSLYHYDETANRMAPKFTTNLNSKDNMHNYIELPDYYLVSCYQPNPPKTMLAMIDKQTLKGSYVRLILDMMGDIDVTNTGFVDGNYILNIPPFYLQKQWMNWQDLSDLPAGVAKFVKYLQNSDAEDMNNVILIGKLKQSKDEGFTLKDMDFDPNRIVEQKNVSQPTVSQMDDANDDTIYEYKDLDIWAIYPDGDVQGVLKYVKERVHYPENLRADIKGLINVSFVVNKDGSLSDITLKKGLDPALDEQVIQAFKGMPKWKPAKKDGKTVRSSYLMAVGVSKEDNK